MHTLDISYGPNTTLKLGNSLHRFRLTRILRWQMVWDEQKPTHLKLYFHNRLTMWLFKLVWRKA